MKEQEPRNITRRSFLGLLLAPGALAAQAVVSKAEHSVNAELAAGPIYQELEDIRANAEVAKDHIGELEQVVVYLATGKKVPQEAFKEKFDEDVMKAKEPPNKLEGPIT